MEGTSRHTGDPNVTISTGQDPLVFLDIELGVITLIRCPNENLQLGDDDG
jgi:hypothetical protein